MKYNVWNAVAYEVTDWMIYSDPRWEINQIVTLIRDNCLNDWVEWRTERTMVNVDKQLDNIQNNPDFYPEDAAPIIREISKQDPKTGIITEFTLEISAPWVENEDE